MIRKRNFLRLLLLFPFVFNVSQAQTEVWMFGETVGMDFTQGAPTLLSNSAMYSVEGVASVSDTAGNLLFYSDGDTIWNRNHQPMPNGTALDGHWSSTQGTMIVKKPGSATIYYVFSNDAADNFGFDGLQYHVVDMSLDNGNGDVTLKNQVILGRSSEKLSAVSHSNGLDVWVMAHDFDSMNFYAFRVDTNGINPTPVKSTIAPTFISVAQAVGHMKFSPTGEYLAVAANSKYYGVNLYRFDKALGVLSDRIKLNMDTILGHPYGIAWSSDGTKFYTGEDNGRGLIKQFDISVYDSTTIFNSLIVIGKCNSLRMGSLQLAPDEKIYVTHTNWPAYGTHLGVINNPNLIGTATNYVDNGFALGGNYGAFGLPNFVQSDLWVESIPSFNIEASVANILPYPNPATEKFTFTLDQYRGIEVECEIVTSTGATVVKESSDGLEELLVDVRNLPVGLYYYRLRTTGESLGNGILLIE